MAQIPENLLAKLPKIGKEAMRAIQEGVAANHPVAFLEQLGIGQRLINLLETQGISTLGDLMRRKKEDLLEFPNFGEKQLVVLFTALSKYDNLD